MPRPSFRRHRVAGGSGGGMGMDIAVLGVDLGKNVCSVVGLDGMARPSFRRHRVAGGSGGGMGMDIAVLGVDLGKTVCSVVGLDTSGAVVMRRKGRREMLSALAEKLPPCVVGMEAYCGA